MDTPPSRWLYRLALTPFYWGVLIPFALIFSSILYALMVLGVFVYTIYALIFILVIQQYLTKVELKDLKYVYVSSMFATMLVGVPLLYAMQVNTWLVSSVDVALIIVVVIAMFAAETLFKDGFESGKGVRGIGYWKDSAVEMFSEIRPVTVMNVVLIIAASLLSILLLAYTYPFSSQPGVPYLYAIATAGGTTGIVAALLAMNLAIYSTIILLVNILYVADEVSHYKTKVHKEIKRRKR